MRPFGQVTEGPRSLCSKDSRHLRRQAFRYQPGAGGGSRLPGHPEGHASGFQSHGGRQCRRGAAGDQ